MRRSQGIRAPMAPYYAPQHVEEENEVLTDELGNKIHTLKSLSIEIGNEVRYQEKELRHMDDGFERTGGVLGSTRRRVMRMVNSGGRHHLLCVFLFCVLVSFVLWIYLRMR